MPQDETNGEYGVPKAAPTANAPPRKLRKRRVRRTRGAGGRQEPVVPERTMEPLVVVHDGPPSPGASPPRAGEGAGAQAAAHQLVEVDVEREVIGTQLYRERRFETRTVEVVVRPPTREERRAARGNERVRRALRKRDVAEGGLRSTMGYKTFYDLVCNRLGLVLAGFGSAMLLFVMLYDPVRRQPLELGPLHILGLAVAGAVYFAGMVLEMLRAWSWECDAAVIEQAVPAIDGAPATSARAAAAPPPPLPLVPEEALAPLREHRAVEGTAGVRVPRRQRRR